MQHVQGQQGRKESGSSLFALCVEGQQPLTCLFSLLSALPVAVILAIELHCTLHRLGHLCASQLEIIMLGCWSLILLSPFGSVLIVRLYLTVIKFLPLVLLTTWLW
ncbi:hypothetical protein DUNSADRAFT_18037 [Dunaliella salina]|uniref:Uncharacterized protein n=1 Tax=Dunaliella salina TaxID=3046 RepID=A0ABQ7GZH3_DUNSA|nr:hypothetical protein DUNSADRAFT_18037 [Dunaliella salina]|eukprot:KAF5840000.1 hypothetical protein DUNSADRAFT_18037 [Dunaliella salina]